MIYESQSKELDLEKCTRLYPAAVVEVGGEIAQMSLEWAELNKDKVPVKHYVLVFDFDPLSEIQVNRQELIYKTYDEFIIGMREVDAFINKVSK